MEAILFIGIQATGKSSFYQERFFKTHVRINLDMLKTRHRENTLLQACLEMKQPFVVDNTNPTREERARYIRAAKASGFRLVGYFFQSRVEPALERNETRPGPERVPAKAIRGTRNKLQMPTRDEGFDELYYVAINPVQGFFVQEWTQ